MHVYYKYLCLKIHEDIAHYMSVQVRTQLSLVLLLIKCWYNTAYLVVSAGL
jgi:hypothetical protein